eukprot:164881_1
MSLLEALSPPTNFGVVEAGLFRCSCSQLTADHITYLESLDVGSVCVLSQELPGQILTNWVDESGIHFAHIGLSTWRPGKWSVVNEEMVKEALEFILNQDNQPAIVMCSSGIHETGAVIGCLRRMQNWNLTSIFNEYDLYAGQRSRTGICQFIELFDMDIVSLPKSLPNWFSMAEALMSKEREDIKLRIAERIRQVRQGTRYVSRESHAFQQFYYAATRAPLISEGVRYDAKKSICDIDDD